jgi:acetate kinase
VLILVVNSGSSSIKADVLDPASGNRVVSARLQRLGTPQAVCTLDGVDQALGSTDHAGALAEVLPRMLAALPDGATLSAVGHRVVHGGERFVEPTLIDGQVEAAIEALFPLAPLHNPPNLAGVRAARALLPDLVHVAVFDTAFHSTLPRRARAYALDADLAEEKGLRRYGFHGTSHAWVSRRAAAMLGEDVRELRLITLHLGNGCSAAAVEFGRSIETSMGLTPLEGLVMGTRCGDLDPGLVLQLLRDGMSVDELDHLLNKKSGLAGLSGVGNDMRDIEARAGEGDQRARLALHVFCHRARKYVGAYAAVMGGVDAIIFTGGIGENSALVRHRIAQRLEFLGARLHEDRNREARVSREDDVAVLSDEHSRVRILAVATDEEREIARQVVQVIEHASDVDTVRPIPVSVSARHVHLTQEAVEVLYGPGATLTPRNPLTQPGQFAAEQTVEIVGPKRSLKARILGPVRSAIQIEVSTTDEFQLGVDAPVRPSGDVKGSAGCTLVGPAGRLVLSEGVICAYRHIHMTPEDAAHYGVQDKDVVGVTIDSKGRDLTFGDVLVRVKDSYRLEMHIDTDEANAAGIERGSHGMLVGTDRSARLTRKQVR